MPNVTDSALLNGFCYRIAEFRAYVQVVVAEGFTCPVALDLPYPCDYGWGGVVWCPQFCYSVIHVCYFFFCYMTGVLGRGVTRGLLVLCGLPPMGPLVLFLRHKCGRCWLSV